MKITIKKEQFQNGLQIVQNAVGARSSLPILSNVLLSAVDGNLELTGSDLDLTISSSVAAQVDVPGKTTLPAKRLQSIIRELPSQDITVESNDEGKCKIECGSVRYSLYGIPAADYPQLRTIKDERKIVIDQDKLKGMLKKTGFSASQEEGRYVLNGTYIEFKEHKIVVVATDGRRLALVEEDYDVPENAKGGIIIPVKGVNELNRLLNEKGTVEVNFIENFVKFKLNNEEGSPIQIFTKLIEGSFPNYRQVVPTESKYRIEIYREEFLGALRRAELVTSERQSSVKLSFTQNQLTITTNTPEVGDFLETVAVRFSGEDFSVAFNPAFLIEPLSVLTEDVIFFELTDHMSPGVVKINGPFLYVVMPMRLQE